LGTLRELLNIIKYTKVYYNTEKDKLNILKDNQEMSGVYMWENKNNGKFYIGSSTDIKRRLMSYYNINYLAKHSTSYINNALLKEGFSAFRLYIIEYCKKRRPYKKSFCVENPDKGFPSKTYFVRTILF